MDTPKTNKIPVGHIDNIFKWYEKQGKDASGNVPVIIKLDPEERKRNKSIISF